MNSIAKTNGRISYLGTLLTSLIIAGTTIYFLYYLGYIVLIREFPSINNLTALIFYYLGHSLFFFCLAITFFGITLFKLNRLLNARELDEVSILHQYGLSSLYVNIVLFIGVAFTAIGLINALQASIGSLDGQEDAARLGAWQIMKKLVDGGLVVALSTTVFGGICGYSMKLFRTVVFPGEKLTRFFAEQETIKHGEILEKHEETQNLLKEIHKTLNKEREFTAET